MNRPLACLRVQLRHLSIVQLVVDTIAMIAVGMLAMFVLLLATFQGFDAVLFESGLRYDTREVVDAPSDEGLTLTATEGTLVMSAARFDDPDRWEADYNDSRTPTVWRHADDGAALSELLSAGIIAGDARGQRTLLDEATAVALDVTVGDQLVLTRWDDGECRVTLSGITRSYHEVGDRFIGGLLIVPADACADELTTWTQDATEYLQFNGPHPSASAQSWSDRVLATVSAAIDIRATGILLAILLVGIVLWTLTGLRTARRIREQLDRPSELLFDLGCTAGQVRQTHLLVAGSLTVIAAFGAAWGTSELLWRMASFYIQPAHWLSLALLFAVVTTLVNHASHIRANREASRRPTIHPAATATGIRNEGDA